MLRFGSSLGFFLAHFLSGNLAANSVSPLFANAWLSSGTEPIRSFRTTPTANMASALSEPVTTTTSEEIIPREVLFGNPTYASPKLSPDGRYIAYLAPNKDNVLNIFVRPVVEGAVEGSITSRLVTQDRSRGIGRRIIAGQNDKIVRGLVCDRLQGVLDVVRAVKHRKANGKLGGQGLPLDDGPVAKSTIPVLP